MDEEPVYALVVLGVKKDAIFLSYQKLSYCIDSPHDHVACLYPNDPEIIALLRVVKVEAFYLCQAFQHQRVDVRLV